MRFSEFFKIKKTYPTDWYDPFPARDTRLFIDPFLLGQYSQGPFYNAYEEVLDFVNVIFEIATKSKGSKYSENLQKAIDLLSPGEFSAICLGYTGGRISGSGFGKGLARTIAESMCEVRKKRLTSLQFLEDLCLFSAGNGPDRMCDFIAGTIRHRLVNFTVAVCRKYPKIPTQSLTLLHNDYTMNSQVWKLRSVKLPLNPNTLLLNPNNVHPILLVPKKILRELPTISIRGFWNASLVSHKTIINKTFPNWKKKTPTYKEISAFARQHPRICEGYIKKFKASHEPEPYDFEIDPLNICFGYQTTKQYVDKNPILGTISSIKDLLDFINKVAYQFKNFIENQHGKKRLWGSPHIPLPEHSVQNLFYGILSHYCQTKKIRFSPEYKAGNGVLDFTKTNEITHTSFLMVKLARHIRLTPSFQSKLEKELRTKNCKSGFFIVIYFNQSGFKKISPLRDVFAEINENTGADIEVMGIKGK